jgi:hypothetical protein
MIHMVINFLKVDFLKQNNINVNRIYAVENGYNIELEFLKEVY